MILVALSKTNIANSSKSKFDKINKIKYNTKELFI